jgi:SAM-dependent methyltransferase
MLALHGSVYAVEPNTFAYNCARRIPSAIVRQGTIPFNSPFEDKRFDLIVLLDVLEHIEDDVNAIRALHSLLKKDGYVLITVPAHRWLWSSHDLLHQHHRRYKKKQLCSLITSAGFSLDYFTSFNTLLSPFAVGTRLLQRLSSKETHDDLSKGSELLNEILYRIFRLERRIVSLWTFPFGISMLAVARNHNT